MEIPVSLAALEDLFGNFFGKRPTVFDPSVLPIIGDGGPNDLARKTVSRTGAAYYAQGANGVEYFLPATITYQDSQGQNVKWDLLFQS